MNNLKTTPLIELSNRLSKIDSIKKQLEQEELIIVKELQRRFPGYFNDLIEEPKKNKELIKDEQRRKL